MYLYMGVHTIVSVQFNIQGFHPLFLPLFSFYYHGIKAIDQILPIISRR